MISNENSSEPSIFDDSFTLARNEIKALQAQRDIEHKNADPIEALQACQKLLREALPKFNWGDSFLDVNAIKLLNEVLILVDRVLETNNKP